MHTFFFHLKPKQYMYLVAIIRYNKTPDVPPNSYKLWEEYALLNLLLSFRTEPRAWVFYSVNLCTLSSIQTKYFRCHSR